MTEMSAELRTTSDMLLLDLEALGTLEEQKRATPHGDEKLADLAARIEELAHKVLAGSRRQRELTEQVTEAAAAGDIDGSTTIEEMRPASEILADWREAERAARDAPLGSVERAQASLMIDRFRDEYQRSFETARRRLE